MSAFEDAVDVEIAGFKQDLRRSLDRRRQVLTLYNEGILPSSQALELLATTNRYNTYLDLMPESKTWTCGYCASFHQPTIGRCTSCGAPRRSL